MTIPVFGALRARLLEPRWRQGLSLLVLVALVGLLVWRATPLGQQVVIAQRTRERVQNDRDLHALPRLLGPEYPIVEKLWQDFSPGTAVSIPWPGDRYARRVMLGFWFALLPDYPVRADGSLAIRLASEIRPEDEVLQRGRQFALIRPEARPR